MSSKETVFSRAQLHTHTYFSDGMVSPRKVVKAAFDRHVKVVAFTDHDTMKAIPEAVEAGHEYGVHIIPGEEITIGNVLNQRHLIALFITRTIPHGKSLDYVMKEIQSQGGIAIIPHFDTGRPSFKPTELIHIAQNYEISGIEVFNGTTNIEEKIKALPEETRIRLGAPLGSADSHFGDIDIDSAYTEFSGTTIEDLREAIIKRTTVPIINKTPRIPNLMRFQQHLRANIVVAGKRTTGRL